MSVPHVPLIPFDLMSAQQSSQFILKAQLAMVLLLPGDVLFNLLQVGLANREIRLLALPLEIGVIRSLLLEPEIGHPL
jgi:Tfp pilus assembly protein PilN